MTTETTDTSFDIAIACRLTAEEQAQRGEDFARLFESAEDVAELPDGYALKFPNRDAWITRAVQLIVAERKCCPFFRFTLAFEPEEGPVWLHIAGPGDVKDWIGGQCVPPRLREKV